MTGGCVTTVAVEEAATVGGYGTGCGVGVYAGGAG